MHFKIISRLKLKIESNMKVSTTLFVCVLIVVGIQYTDACQGHAMAIKNLDNCASPKQIIKIYTNSSVSLSENCKLTVNVCVETSGFKTAKGEYTFTKNGQKLMSGRDFDVCKALKRYGPQLGPYMKALQLPDFKCPISKMRPCLNQTFDISKFRTYLPAVLGTIEMKTRMKHNNGNTCLGIALEVYKN